jgi:hypothetical protein
VSVEVRWQSGQQCRTRERMGKQHVKWMRQRLTRLDIQGKDAHATGENHSSRKACALRRQTGRQQALVQIVDSREITKRSPSTSMQHT